MNETDHLLAAALTLLSLSLLFRRDFEPAPISRHRFYLAASLTSFGLGGLTLFLWKLAGRPVAEFGLLDWSGDPGVSVVGGLLWAMGLGVFVSAMKRGWLQAPLLKIYERHASIFPRTGSELAASWGVSLAAGAGEEIAYRGFLLWYASLLFGWPAGLLLSSLLFGIAHGYQSWFGIIFATFAGLALGAVYLASGSLLLVMWIHATYDMASFTTGRILLRRKAELQPGRSNGSLAMTQGPEPATGVRGVSEPEE